MSNPKPGHTTGGSGRGARRSGQAGSGKIGCQRNNTPRKQKSTVPSKKRGNVASTSLQKHEQANDAFFVFCKPFSCKACPGKTRKYYGRVGAGRQGSRAGQNGTPTGRFAQERTVLLTLWRIKDSPEARTWETLLVESKTRTYHGRFESGRPADGGAGSGRTGCQQNCSPRGQGSPVDENSTVEFYGSTIEPKKMRASLWKKCSFKGFVKKAPEKRTFIPQRRF